MLSIIYNNKNSYIDFGLVITGNIVRPSVSKTYDSCNVPERRGSLNVFQYYNDNEITVNFGFKTYENITLLKSKILEWLNSVNSKELMISDDLSVYYIVNKVSVSGFDGKNIKTFSCTFTVDPFMHLKNNFNLIEINSPTNICDGRANVEAEPYFKIYGSGDITININEQALILKNVDGYIEVDSKEMNCYKEVNGKKENQNNRMYSKFPILSPGDNAITWSGNVTKIEINPRWCCM